MINRTTAKITHLCPPSLVGRAGGIAQLLGVASEEPVHSKHIWSFSQLFLPGQAPSEAVLVSRPQGSVGTLAGSALMHI